MEAISWSQEATQIVPSSSFQLSPAPSDDASGYISDAVHLYNKSGSFCSIDDHIGQEFGKVIDNMAAPSRKSSTLSCGSELNEHYDNFSTNLDDLFEALVQKNGVEQEMIDTTCPKFSIKCLENIKQETTNNNSCSNDSSCGHSSVEASMTVSQQADQQHQVNGSSVFDTANDSIELYHDLIMRHLVQDIVSTSSRLKISSDPRSWNVEQSQIWLADVALQYNLSQIPCDLLNMPGSILCSIDLEILRMVFPAGAELIHAQLNLWTTANDYSNKSQCELGRIKQEAEPMWAPFYNSQNVNNGQFVAGFNNHAEMPGNIINRSSNFKKEQKLPPSFVYPMANTEFPTNSPSSDSGFSTDSEEYYNEGLEPSSSSPWQKVNHPLPMVTNYYFQNNNIHLWQFLRELLDNQDKYSFCVRWLDRPQGIFKIEDSHKLAKFWGQRKNRPAMNYDKLSRSLRQYYRKGILKKTARSQRLVYQFLSPYHIC